MSCTRSRPPDSRSRWFHCRRQSCRCRIADTAGAHTTAALLLGRRKGNLAGFAAGCSPCNSGPDWCIGYFRISRSCPDRDRSGQPNQRAGKAPGYLHRRRSRPPDAATHTPSRSWSCMWWVCAGSVKRYSRLCPDYSPDLPARWWKLV